MGDCIDPSFPDKWQLHIAISLVGEFLKVFVGRQETVRLGLGFPCHSHQRLGLDSAAFAELFRTVHDTSRLAWPGSGTSWLFGSWAICHAGLSASSVPDLPSFAKPGSF